MNNLNELSQLGTIGAEMADFCRKARDQMLSAKKKVDARQKDFFLNLAYFCDNQWVEWDEFRHKVVPLPETEDELLSMPRRETNNILRRQLMDSVGQMVGVPPRMEAIAASTQDVDIMNAKMTDRILEALWHNLEMRSFWYDAHIFKAIFGTAFQMAYWDTNGGPVVDGKPQGDVGCLLLSPLRVFADPVADRIAPERKRPTDARWVYILMDYDIGELVNTEKWLTMREEVNEETGCKILYGGMPEEKEIKPMGSSAVSLQEAELMVYSGRQPEEENRFSSIHRYDKNNEKKSGRVTVAVYLEWPSAIHPNGRFAAMLPDNDFWPLEIRNEGMYATVKNPKGVYPITQLTDVVVPGMLLGKSRMTEARPLQDIVNQLISRYSEELKKLTPYFMYDESAGIDEDAMMESITSRVLKYDSRAGGQAPQIVVPTGAAVSENIIESAITFCIRQSEDKMGVHNVRYYTRSAATLGELRMQKNEDLASLESNDVARAEESAYGPFIKSAAQIAKWGYSDERVIEFVGDKGASEVVKFKGEDINFKDVRIVPSSSMPASRHLQKMEMMDLMVKGFMQDPDPKINRELRRMVLRVMNLEMPLEASIEELAANRARDENQKVLDGKQINVHQSEPHLIHITEHQRFLNSNDFYNLEPSMQLAVEVIMLKHIDEHGNMEFDAHNNAGVPAAMSASVAGQSLDITEPGNNPQNPMVLLQPGSGAAPGTMVEMKGASKTGLQGGSLSE